MVLEGLNMNKQQTIRSGMRTRALPFLALGLSLLSGWVMTPSVQAQVSGYGDKQQGENRGDELPNVLKGVAVTQHLNQQLPLNAEFVDETGATVRLGDYFGKKPALLVAGLL